MPQDGSCFAQRTSTHSTAVHSNLLWSENGFTFKTLPIHHLWTCEKTYNTSTSPYTVLANLSQQVKA